MGLREERAIALVKERSFPAVENEIKDTIGSTIPIEVDWASVETAGEDGIFSIEGMAFRKIIGAMLIASHEDFTKKAFAERISGFHVSHVPENAQKAIKVADSRVSLQVNLTDTYEGQFSDQELFDALMDQL